MDFLHFFLEGLALGLICIFGLAANIFSIVILLTSRELDLSSTFARILVALMTYDSIFLFGLLSVFTMPLFMGDYYQFHIYPTIVPYMLPIIQIALTGKF